MTFATHLQSLRTARGWTQAELAQRSLLSQSHISDLESGKLEPTERFTLRLCVALGIPLRELFPSDEDGDAR